MSDLRHIHDPVLSSLKMEGIRLLLFSPCPSIQALEPTQSLVLWVTEPFLGRNTARVLR
jgi:hypothetical protein